VEKQVETVLGRGKAAVSKAGLIHLTRALALELAPEVQGQLRLSRAGAASSSGESIANLTPILI
jgi:hypothetical protein